MTDYVAYTRVSTARQGRSGLGLAAQRHRIKDFVGNDGEIVEWFEEHESATRSRPELERALTSCELTGGTLLIATLDRLSRDVMFLETIKRRCETGGFGFKCADMPDADSFMLGILIQVGQYEREKISERTRLALKAAKRRGTKLGNPNGARNFDGKREIGAKRAGDIHRTGANEWASKRKPIIAELVEAGLSNGAIARELTTRKITTRRGGAWSAKSVSRLRARLDATA